MTDARIELETEDGGALEALAVWSERSAAAAPVILLTDSQGLTDGFRAAAERLAGLGWFVLAPDLLAGGPATRERLIGSTDAQAEAFDAWLHFLQYERRVDDRRVGVVGYGVGGALALRLAAGHAERIAAVASFYGGGPNGWAARRMAFCLNAVVHLGYPADDLWRAAPAIGEFETALAEAGVDYECEFYPGPHGFAIEGSAGHNARAARLHWLRVEELLMRTLAPAELSPDAPSPALGSSGPTPARGRRARRPPGPESPPSAA